MVLKLIQTKEQWTATFQQVQLSQEAATTIAIIFVNSQLTRHYLKDNTMIKDLSENLA